MPLAHIHENTQGQRGRFFRFATRCLKSHELPDVFRAMAEAVRDTMIEDRYPWKHTKAQTEVEKERRMRVCEDLMCVLSGDCHWGLERCKDHLTEYLRKLLNGDDIEPSERRMWSADDGRIVDMSENDVRTVINAPAGRA